MTAVHDALQGVVLTRPTQRTQRCSHHMDLVVLARKLALAFASGESNAGLAAAVQALFPSAAYVRYVMLVGSGMPHMGDPASPQLLEILNTLMPLRPVLAAAQLVAVWQQGHCRGDEQSRGSGIHDDIAHGRALLPLPCDGAAGAGASWQARLVGCTLLAQGGEVLSRSKGCIRASLRFAAAGQWRPELAHLMPTSGQAASCRTPVGRLRAASCAFPSPQCRQHRPRMASR